MRFAWDFSSPTVLLCLGFLVLVFAGLLFSFFLSVRHRQKSFRVFGDPALVLTLVVGNAERRRATKGILFLVGAASIFISFARPQFGSGERLVPARGLDVVIALDYSKSMYARDVMPNRIARAKVEVSELIRGLPGARYGAIAFAGEPMSFPISTDGAAIAQFFRQLEPNDMPVGGTATARALERARDLFERDPKSKEHAKVIVLVTDGEDLEGDPLQVAEKCATEQIQIFVVQIGGRAPEVIPEIDEHGKAVGFRKGQDGKPLTTALSAQGEEQLAKLAETTHGRIYRSEKGSTGIAQVSAELLRLSKVELTEKVQILYDEAYTVPLAIGLACLVLELLLQEVRRWRKRSWWRNALMLLAEMLGSPALAERWAGKERPR